MDQGLDMAACWKHDLSLLWPVSQLTEQCRLCSNDLYRENNRSSSLRSVIHSKAEGARAQALLLLK